MEELQNQSIVFGSEYEEKQDFGLIDEGRYEVIIDKVEKKISKNGNKYLNVRFNIREDIEQPFKRRKLFYTIMGADNRLGYDFNKVNKIILTQKNQPTFKTTFQETDEVLQYLFGLRLSLVVETTFDSNRGNDINIIDETSFSEPNDNIFKKVAQQASTNVSNLPDDVDEDDIPF